jgi:outer membrane protein, heavy metal efflux system
LETAPDLSAGPFVHQEEVREKETTVGIQFSLPFPFWDWNQGNVKTAKARSEQAEASLREEERKIERDVAIAVRNYDLTSEQLEKASSMTVEKLREAAEYTDRRYRLGAINVQLYLEAQRQLLQAYRIRSEAVQEAWHLLHDLKLLTAGELKIAHPHDHDDPKEAD